MDSILRAILVQSSWMRLSSEINLPKLLKISVGFGKSGELENSQIKATTMIWNKIMMPIVDLSVLP